MPRRGVRRVRASCSRFPSSEHDMTAQIDRVRPFAIESWSPGPSKAQCEAILAELEGGAIVHLPRLGFALRGGEARFLSQRWSDGQAKHISRRPGAATVRGAQGTRADLAELGEVMDRYGAAAQRLMRALV